MIIDKNLTDMTIKPLLIKLHWLISSQFGLDPRTFMRSLRGLPVYLRDWAAFRKGYVGNMKFMPCLHDRYEEGGATKSEYFWQDLLVARAIHAAKPAKHVDIGSRVDGFVAHVASFREIEVFDVRPISTAVPGVVFRQADLMNPTSLPTTGGATVTRSHACMPSNTLGWGVMATRSTRKAISAALPIWRSYYSPVVRFIFPHPSVKKGWNLTPTGFLIRTALCAVQRRRVWCYKNSSPSRQPTGRKKRPLMPQHWLI